MKSLRQLLHEATSPIVESDDDEHVGPTYDKQFMYHKSGPYELHSGDGEDDRSGYMDRVFHEDGTHLGGVWISKEDFSNSKELKDDLHHQFETGLKHKIPEPHYSSLKRACYAAAHEEVAPYGFDEHD